MLSFDNTYGPKFQVISITDILTRFFSHRKRKKEEIAPPFRIFWLYIEKVQDIPVGAKLPASFSRVGLFSEDTSDPSVPRK